MVKSEYAVALISIQMMPRRLACSFDDTNQERYAIEPSGVWFAAWRNNRSSNALAVIGRA
jgi:hypothetical protein